MKRRPSVGVRYTQKLHYSAYVSTRVATIFIRDRPPNDISDKLYVMWFPQRTGLSDIAAGYYVLPNQYSVPHGRFTDCFFDLNQAVEHGKHLFRQAMAAHRALNALGVGR